MLTSSHITFECVGGLGVELERDGHCGQCASVEGVWVLELKTENPRADIGLWQSTAAQRRDDGHVGMDNVALNVRRATIRGWACGAAGETEACVRFSCAAGVSASVLVFLSSHRRISGCLRNCIISLLAFFPHTGVQGSRRS